MTDLLDKIPPQNLEAEQAVLGAMLQSPAAIEIASQYLSAESFYMPSHRTLYATLLAMNDGAVPVDLTLLKERLTADGHLEAVGDEAYLITLAESTPTTANAEYYARIVRDKAALRGLIQAGAETIREAHQRDAHAGEVLDAAEKRLLDLALNRDQAETKKAGSVMAQALEVICGEGGMWGIETGIGGLDAILHGLRPGQLIILAARPSVGKSALALTLALNLARRGDACGYFSLEMCEGELANRLLAMVSGVNLWALERGKIGEDAASDLRMAAEVGDGLALYINDTPALRLMDLRSSIRRLVRQRGVKAVLVDYVQLVRVERQRERSREQEVASISAGLKQVARECRIPVVALSQLSRKADEQGRPTLSTLRESGALEQDADVVILLSRNNDGTILCDVAKQRNGPTGELVLVMNRATTLFSEGTQREAQEDAAARRMADLEQNEEPY